MFKTIFGKYLFAFTVILFSCITITLFVMTTMISDYTRGEQQELMDSTAGNVMIVTEVFTSHNGYTNLVNAFSDGNELNRLMEYMAANAESDIYVFDGEGVLAGSTDADIPAGSRSLSSSAVSSIFAKNGETYSVSDVENFFDEKHLNSFFVKPDGDMKIIALVSTPDIGSKVFTVRITNITVTVSLWVFLVAMITLYIISRNTTKPLNDITEAAKNYAKGRFEGKVVVTGHDEVAELGNAINEMADSLARIDEMRNSFLGNVSHDLRTPMTTISGFVDGILDGTIPPDKQEYYLNIISQEVRRLSRLVNSLLELSRLESGANIKRTDFNLSEKARTILLSLENKINAKNLDIDFDSGDDDIYVNADADAMHQVIYNLMDNAIKFSEQGGKIKIRIDSVLSGKKQRKARFAIGNSGQGIPKEELPHVFERFYKTDRSRGLDKTGTGLGLYIVKTSIVNHGEDITVTSEPGGYTEFVFTLQLVEKNHPRKND